MSQLKIKDGNSWINIPAGGIGVPSGGNQGDVLVKSSSTDYETEWTSSPKVPYVEVGTVTLKSGVFFQSWGGASVVKYGKVVVFSFWGVRFSSAHSSDFEAFDLPWKSVSNIFKTEARDGSFILAIGENTQTASVNAVATNTNYYGELVYLTND